MDYFEGLIGQTGLKRKLSFYLDAFAATRRMPFLLFAGAKGLGKTMFAKTLSKHITDEDGTKRPLLELNCSVIRNNEIFFENIFLQYLHDKNVTVLFDECHNLPKDLAQALLTICNSEKDSVRNFTWGETTYSFDFTKLTFLFATTETDQIFGPLKDRMEVVDFIDYSFEDIKALIAMYSDEIVFKGDVLETIARNVRGNARACVKMAQQVQTYCARADSGFFGPKDWDDLRYHLNIFPHGLTSSEIGILQQLNIRGACSLNMLAAATGQSRSAIQRDHESYLLKIGALMIDGKRKITKFGQEILKEASLA